MFAKKRNVMSGIPHRALPARIHMVRVLESAVILGWKDLLPTSQEGLVHIEYAPGTLLPYVKIWQLTGKGEWSLVCEYWMSRGPTRIPAEGMTFSNGYYSAGLAEMLEVIMQHQESFEAPLIAPGTGLIQVTPPTDQESAAATDYIRQTYESLGISFAPILTAASA
jgi:hypothetical protein